VAKDFINDPNYWRNRANETRELAKRVDDDAARKRLSALATEFARIAAECRGPNQQDERQPIVRHPMRQSLMLTANENRLEIA
jgi:hypothetical protein